MRPTRTPSKVASDLQRWICVSDEGNKVVLEPLASLRSRLVSIRLGVKMELSICHKQRIKINLRDHKSSRSE